MADEVDRANELADLMVQSAFNARKRQDLPFCGQCYNCNEAVKMGSFCCRECADDWQLRENMARLNGRGW